MTVAVRMGPISYLDEVVEARQDTRVVIHPLTDHRRNPLSEKIGELVTAHSDFQIGISYNRSGHARHPGRGGQHLLLIHRATAPESLSEDCNHAG